MTLILILHPNSAFIFAVSSVEYYNKVVITFNSINMPYNRLKLRSIDLWQVRIFMGQGTNLRMSQSDTGKTHPLISYAIPN